MKYLFLATIILNATSIAFGQDSTTDQSSWLSSVTVYIDAIAQLLLALTTVATIVVRMTPSEADDKKVGKWVAKLLKILGYLPTLGINPRTKKLEEALGEMKKK